MKEFAGPPTRRTSRLSAAAALLAADAGARLRDAFYLAAFNRTIARSPVTFRIY